MKSKNESSMLLSYLSHYVLITHWFTYIYNLLNDSLIKIYSILNYLIFHLSLNIQTNNLYLFLIYC